MNNKQIIEQVESIQAGILDKSLLKQEQQIKFLVFYINDRLFAFYAEQIKEIIMDTPLFFVPFVPPYVRGFINRHGEPYTVIDMNLLFGKDRIDSTTYLILNKKEDQVAFIISAIREIVKIPESQVHPAAAVNTPGNFFKGSFAFEQREIFILDPDNVGTRVANDIEAAG